MRRVTRDAVHRALPEVLRETVLAVARSGDAQGVGVHLVGGPVRDFLLGRPVRDVDLIVEPREGRGDAAAVARGAELPDARVVVHARFGTVHIEQGGGSLDLATVRSEQYASPGALPTIGPGELLDDLRRRDFRINALAVPLNECAGRGRPALIDPGEGLADLRERVLRIFHARSFHDDPTRALRASRLAPRLGMSLARSSRSALRSALRDGAFGAVKGERYRTELVKVFTDPAHGLDPARALRLLEDWHVLAALEPGLGLPPEVRPSLKRLGKDLAREPSRLRSPAPWVAGLRIWLAPLSPGLRRRVLRRLAVRGEQARRIAGHPAEAARLLRSLAGARGRGAVDALMRELPEDAMLALTAQVEAPLSRRLQRWRHEDRAVALPVSGRDLVALGLEGPAVGKALARIRLAVLDRAVQNREEALALAREVRAPRSRKKRR